MGRGTLVDGAPVSAPFIGWGGGGVLTAAGDWALSGVAPTFIGTVELCVGSAAVTPAMSSSDGDSDEQAAVSARTNQA